MDALDLAPLKNKPLSEVPYRPDSEHKAREVAQNKSITTLTKSKVDIIYTTSRGLFN